MSKPDKPIFNQQGGRGKLYGPTHGATYMGTYQMPDGKMDRRMFNCATNKDAIRAYTDWCADMDARILEAMKEKVRPKAKAQQPKEKPAYTEPFKKDEDETIPSPLIGDFRYGKVTEWLWAKKNDDGTDYWPGRRAVLYKHNDPPKEGDMSSAGYRCCVFAEALDK